MRKYAQNRDLSIMLLYSWIWRFPHQLGHLVQIDSLDSLDSSTPKIGSSSSGPTPKRDSGSLPESFLPNWLNQATRIEVIA